MASSRNKRKWVKNFSEINVWYQVANVLAFAMEHLDVYFRANKDTAGYEIRTDDHKNSIVSYHAFLHLYTSSTHAYSINMPINVWLFVLKAYGHIPQTGYDSVDKTITCSAQTVAGYYHNLMFLSLANPIFKINAHQEGDVRAKLAALSVMDTIACLYDNKISGILSSTAKMFSVPTDGALWGSILVKSSTLALEAFYDIYDYIAEEQIDANITQGLRESSA